MRRHALNRESGCLRGGTGACASAEEGGGHVFARVLQEEQDRVFIVSDFTRSRIKQTLANYRKEKQ